MNAVNSSRYGTGFTLIELIVVIVIAGIIATTVGVFIQRPVLGYVELARRAELVDAAESALRLMARDIRRALPNSVRCNNNCNGATAIEVINTVDAVRYRLDPPGTQDQRLRFNNTDEQFNSIGPFRNITKPFASNGHRLVIYNLGIPGSADAYDPATGVITPDGMAFSINADGTAPDEDRVVLDLPGHQFSFESERQRLFLVDGAISYVCNTVAGTLIRYTGYAMTVNMAVPPAGGGNALVAEHVSGCTIDYQPGTATRAALATVQLTLTDGGESVNLLHQIHVDNAP